MPVMILMCVVQVKKKHTGEQRDMLDLMTLALKAAYLGAAPGTMTAPLRP
jgi:hypothetical protein